MQTPIHTYTYACINGGKAHQIININNIARIFVATFNTKRQLVTTAATTTANTPQRQLRALRAMCRQQQPLEYLVVLW